MKKRLILLCLLVCSYIQIFAQPRGPFVRSPEINNDGSVTFRYLAPSAKEVLLGGSQFGAVNVPMHKDSIGIWSTMVKAIKPDIYPYSFKVDGISVMDPANVEFFPNERFKASLVNIPGENPLMHAIKNVPHGAVSYEFYSSIEGSTGYLAVYTPPGYSEEQAKNYPVYYLISGTTDTEEAFFKVGKVNFIMDNMIAAGKAEPMIIVMPYGNPMARIAEQQNLSKPDDIRSRDSEEAIIKAKYFETDLVTKVIPFVEENYRVIANRQNRAIGGFSRGGGQTLRVGFNNMDKFAWICSYASYITPQEMGKQFAQIKANPEKTNSQLSLLWSGIGTSDFLYQGTQEFEAYLKEKNINFKNYVTDGGHTWMNVKEYLNETLPILFK